MKADSHPYMRKTLLLARRGIGKTSPNPMVGAIIVRDGKEVGSGYHHGPGQPHAEVNAMDKAGLKAKGGTLYTNLEPCCHTDKRTPPCTQAIIKSGIKRVVVAMEDPNPKVCGRGIKQLLEAGLSVTTSVLQSEATRLNECYIKYMQEKKPFVILKAGMTLDGRIATSQGESKWITGATARQEARQLRSRVDAVLVGIGTALADNPGLLANENGKNPLRVLIDPHLEIPFDSQLAAVTQQAPTLVFTLASESSKKALRLQQQGVQVKAMRPDSKGGIPFHAILMVLGKMEITSLLIEGGGGVNGRAIREGIVDKVIFYIAPRLLCGNDAKAVIDGKALLPLDKAVQLYDINIRKVSDDLRVEGYLKKGSSCLQAS
jgi:diaminohydroxyphosphoribosylaminopyrimidine deaminase/5-amino-6-(5-phosphoribosylamino)uracil reductase